MDTRRSKTLLPSSLVAWSPPGGVRDLTFGTDEDENGSGERLFRSGDYIPVSFAIWNGDARDRDGKKNISIWQRLVIE